MNRPKKVMNEDFVRFLTAKLGYAPSTIHNHRYRLLAFQTWLKENNLKLEPKSCEKYLYSKKMQGQSSATLNMYMDLFSCLDKYYTDRGLTLNLSRGFKRFTIDKKHIDLLSVEEIERLTTTFIKFKRPNRMWIKRDKVYLLLTVFLAYTGCRYAEASDLRIKDVDTETGRVLIPKSKNGSYRYVYLPPPIVARLMPLLRGDPDDLVFSTMRGVRIYDSNFIANLQKRAKQCGINKRVYPHLFRHSMATQLITDGVPIEQVAVILGHKDITTTFDTYVHLADETVKKAMYRHSLFKKSTAPSDIIQAIIESVKNFKLETDDRFDFNINQGKNSLDLQLFVK